MKHPSILLLVALVNGISTAGAQESPPAGLNLAEYKVIPESPSFAEPFTVEVVLRLDPGTSAVLGRALEPSEAMEGLGAGRIEVLDGPADSVEVRATYPVIAYRSGLQALPLLPISLSQTPAATPGASAATIASDSTMLADSLWTMLRIGAAPVGKYLPLEDSTAVQVPRPPADVLGGDWSIWLLLAVGFASAAGVGGVGMMVPRWWSATGGALISRIRRRSPRHDALKELERLKSLGWHRNGKVDDFYAGFTRAWRGYAERLDPALGTGLTSTELLSRLEQKWGSARMKSLTGIVSTAEKVKFGGLAPPPDEAERDWSAVREWVRSGPAA
jgi:hypothetical protein